MKLGIISDLHIRSHIPNINKENINKYIKKIFNNNIDIDLDIIIISGDISEDNNNIILFFKELIKVFPEVKILFTHGNHEMWDHISKNNVNTIKLMIMFEENKNISNLKKEMEKLKSNKSSYKKIKELKNSLKDFKNLYYLDGETITINNKKILGIPMWYDFSYGIKNFKLSIDEILDLWKNYMYDSELIFWDEEQFNPIKYFSKQYKKIKNLFKKEKPDIVFSHVGPIVPKNIPEKWKNASTGFYFFDGKELFDIHQPDLWIFGHTHDKYDFKYKNTRMICNPYGYRREKNNYVKIIEI